MFENRIVNCNHVISKLTRWSGKGYVLRAALVCDLSTIRFAKEKVDFILKELIGEKERENERQLGSPALRLSERIERRER